MSERDFEIRLCLNPSCGLRYPLPPVHPFGMRCPLCLGETSVVLRRSLPVESGGRGDATGPGPSVLMDNIRSAWNAGSMLRTADGAGFTHAFLCGVTPTPENSELRKTSLGAEESMSWSSHRDGTALASRLAVEGFHMLALETASNALPLRRLDLSGIDAPKLVLVVGSELAGIDPGILGIASRICYIPMRGRKNSLNAAVAFGIAAFEVSEKLARANDGR